MNSTALRTARKAKNLTQEALAQLVGTSQPYIAQLENEDRGIEISASLLFRFAAALNVTPAALMHSPTTPVEPEQAAVA